VTELALKAPQGDRFVVGVFSWTWGAVELCGAIVCGSSDWEWFDRGSVQKFGGSSFEADDRKSHRTLKNK
jgi:hypothetical protein